MNEAAAEPQPSRGRGALLLKWAISLLLAAFFVWLSARNWPLDKLFGGDLRLGTDRAGRAALLQVDAGQIAWSLAWRSLLLSMGLFFCIHWLRIVRWRQFLVNLGPAPLRTVNRVGAVGFMAIFLLPFRLGEVVRPVLISRHTGIPVGAAAATIAVERVIDGLMVSLLMFLVLLGLPDGQLERYEKVVVGGYTALAVFGSASILLLATAVARELTSKLLRAVVGSISSGLAEKIIGLATSFVDGIRVLESPLAAAQFVGITAVIWGVTALNMWVLSVGFGLGMPILGAFTMMCCVVVGMMIPNTPGNVGSFWYFMLLPAGIYGIDPDAPASIAFGLVVWFLTMGNQTLYGIWGLWARRRLMAAGARGVAATGPTT